MKNYVHRPTRFARKNSYERLRHDESLWQAAERISPAPLDPDARQIARLEARIEDLNNIDLLLKESRWIFYNQRTCSLSQVNWND